MADNAAEIDTLDPFVEYSYSYGPAVVQENTIGKTVAEVRTKVAPLRFMLAARNISQELELTEGQKVLELGSGLGLLGQAIKKEVNGKLEYSGIELAYKSAKESKDKGLFGIQADSTNLPFADNSFDALVSTDVLEHIPDSDRAVEEIKRVLKPGGKAFLVIADPSEARFDYVHDHIDRSKKGSDVEYWEDIIANKGLKVLTENSNKYRSRDWRKIFNLPFLVKLKDKPGFACAFNPVNRPGTYVVQKPENE